MESGKKEYSVVVVDDQEINRVLLDELMRKEGFDVALFESGDQCLKYLELNTPDLFLLDVMMPKMDGFELCKKIRSHPTCSEVPVVFLTALDDEEGFKKGFEAGGTEYIAKPVKSNVLALKVKSLLTSQKVTVDKYTLLQANRDLKKEVKERTLTEEKMKRRVEELSAINEIFNEITNSPQLNIMLEKILDKVMKITEQDGGGIYLINPENNKLMLEAFAGFKNYGDLEDKKAVEPGSEVYDEVLKTKSIRIVSDMPAYSGVLKDFLIKEDVKQFVSLPIMSKEKIIGIINLASRKKTGYLEENIRFMEMISRQTGLAIENSRLFQDTKKAFEELKKAQAFLLQSEKMASVGQLAAGVAHEINNPTGFVHSNLGSMQKYIDRMMALFAKYDEGLLTLAEDGNEEIAAFVEEIKALKKKLKFDYITEDINDILAESMEGTERIRKIVGDLKCFSRVDQGELKPADINEGIESTLNVVWNELKYKCTVEKNYGDLPLVCCNHGQLNQVFMNLLVNASHAIEKQGTITIATRFHESLDGLNNQYPDGCVEISIADTGTGIPEKTLKDIFNPFFTTKEVGKGTGLGLSIAYDIVSKHNGEISVESEVGKGTCFKIILPMVKDEKENLKSAE